MKIIYFNYLYDRLGISLGSTRKAELLLSEVEKLGYDIRIYWRKPLLSEVDSESVSERLRSPLKKRFAKWLHEPAQLLRNLKFLVEEWKILRQEKPDLLIIRTDLLLFSGILLAKLFRIPVLAEADAPCSYEAHTFHTEFKPLFSLAEWVEKTNLKYANRSICVSNCARSLFMEMGVPSSCLNVIPNGAEPEKFQPGDRMAAESKGGNSSEFKIASKGPVIGFAGTFHHWHGVDILIRLIKRTLTAYPDCTFLLVGRGGPMKPQLDEFVATLDNPDRVVTPGYVPYEEMPNMIQKMDIVIAPYPDMNRFYFSPVKIYEYMAAGKPVISTRIGQIAEVIEHEENGLLCEPGNESAMADMLLNLLNSPEQREKLGTNAARTICEKHTWKHRAKSWANEIEQAFEASHR